MKPGSRIIQIIPALPGWRAVYGAEEGPLFRDVVCWGLIEDMEEPTKDDPSKGFRCVEGFAAGDMIDTVEDHTNFIGYAEPGDTEKNWETPVNEYLEREKFRPA